MKFICLSCSKEFSVIGNTEAKYCSRRCYWNAMKNFPPEKTPAWRGGICHQGPYIQIKSNNHPFKDARGYVFEHRLVMEKYIGRYLTKNEVIHHIDGNRSNNLLDNLLLLKRGEHASTHHLGAKRSPESCAKIRLINIGRVRSAETRKKIGDAVRLRVVSAETRLKHSIALKKRWEEIKSREQVL